MNNRPVISFEEWTRKLESFRIPKQHLNELVMNYLVVEGHKQAAEMFREEAGVSPGIDLESLDDRKRIRDYIMAGSIDEAITELNKLDPHILDSNSELSSSSACKNSSSSSATTTCAKPSRTAKKF